MREFVSRKDSWKKYFGKILGDRKMRQIIWVTSTLFVLHVLFLFYSNFVKWMDFNAIIASYLALNDFVHFNF